MVDWPSLWTTKLPVISDEYGDAAEATHSTLLTALGKSIDGAGVVMIDYRVQARGKRETIQKLGDWGGRSGNVAELIGYIDARVTWRIRGANPPTLARPFGSNLCGAHHCDTQPTTTAL